MKWAIDPGLEGDVYSDTPYLYGNALSSVNVLRVGEKITKGEGLPNRSQETEDDALEEGGDGEGLEWRKERGAPEAADARKKHFLSHGKPAEWEWEEERVYMADFFNPFLDFNEFALKLPGFSLSILPYLGGEDHLRYVNALVLRPSQSLNDVRYVLKNKDTGEVFFVVVFTLLPRDAVDRVEREGQAKEINLADSEAIYKPKVEQVCETRADDVD